VRGTSATLRPAGAALVVVDGTGQVLDESARGFDHFRA
jgi:hypothetical protein